MLFGRHIAELNGTNNTLVRSYVWGLDLSGAMDGAGGVGGLLWVTLHTVSGPAAGTHFAACDGNGNVVALVSATTGIETARYEYGPFGELIRITGPAATLNPFRFSTKRTDNTTDLVLYEYRVYLPSTGSWLSRDPIGEQNENNIYVFVHNDATSIVDLDGLSYGNNAPPIVIDPLWTAPAKSLSPVYPILIPQPPPRIPPSAPPRQPPGGAPTNPGNAAGGAISLCGLMWNDIFNRWEFNDGIKICRSQMGLQSKGEKCCVMLFCINQNCCSGMIRITRVMAYLDSKPCSASKEEFETPGKVLKSGCHKGEKVYPEYVTMFNFTNGYGN
jgi:RHS repeat-associated protein